MGVEPHFYMLAVQLYTEFTAPPPNAVCIKYISNEQPTNCSSHKLTTILVMAIILSYSETSITGLYDVLLHYSKICVLKTLRSNHKIQ
jgi:hypothetical protein